MIGGTSDAALRRTARIGDIWQAFGLTPEVFRTRRNTLQALAPGRPIKAGTMLATTDTAHAAEDLVHAARRWEAVGADQLTVLLGALPDVTERMTEFIRNYPRNSPR
jgi:alkanesulfonate monooxygenase SsuD/methylene tetrahydromethanopterin reductase-like flavin-dependent oxidoreductase (luciferase family)